MKSRLERFEDKYGIKDELIFKYTKAAYSCSRNYQEILRLSRLLRVIDKLIAYEVGYQLGFKAGRGNQSRAKLA